MMGPVLGHGRYLFVGFESDVIFQDTVILSGHFSIRTCKYIHAYVNGKCVESCSKIHITCSSWYQPNIRTLLSMLVAHFNLIQRGKSDPALQLPRFGSKISAEFERPRSVEPPKTINIFNRFKSLDPS